ncbi:exopolysaccharide biosynthesis polyprenyl glycosylphosphotransferase [uncultured Polaribacter sp.]|uniref:exopolysaccharide biosynthesis polyprenyl glycosylphosphotransferase n=1 Tax=uncultured Polaribacter sp. TaxID=174711 RepID=UPI00259B4BA9|nr:exopolysaccharide biosynthesis polyprenyl glycosylphosphotransferase [uncultured Polaribacter sp.]
MTANKSYINISERKIFLRIIDLLVVFFSLWMAFIYIDFTYIDFKSELVFNWFILLAFYFLIFGQIFQLYNLNVSNNRYLVVSATVLNAFATTIFYTFTPFLSPILPQNRLQIVYFFLILFIPIIIWRFAYMSLIFSPKYFKSVLFIGKSDKIEKLLHKINNDSFHNIATYISDKEIDGIKGFKNINNTKISKFIDKNYITEVVVSNKGLSEDNIKLINKELILLFEQGVNIISYESFYEEVNARVPREYLNHNFYKHINFSKNNTNRFYLFGLRIVDIIVSFVGMLFFITLLPFCLIGNLFANRGPLFYTQNRVGENGVIFKIYKLRSMIKNAESNGAVWAKKNDVRITSFGKFLRRTRLDEFPQFINILKGDMSIIGPRPERPEFVIDLEEKIPFYAIRHIVRPGLTGWAQVNYPYANTIQEQETKLRYDLYYIKERSAFLDFKILIKTITTVLYFRGQ